MDNDTPAPRSMTLDEFTPLVGRTFQLDCEPRTAELRLIEALPGRYPGIEDRRPFSLTFHSGLDKLLVSGTYVMRCGKFGPDMIHISPVSPRPDADPGHYYQAIFN